MFVRRLTQQAPRLARSMADAPAAGGAGRWPSKLSLTFMCPHKTLAHKKQVRMVTLPSSNGVFGVLPGHIPTIAELKPGVVKVHGIEGEDPSHTEVYFVSGGFAFINKDSSLNLAAAEAVTLDEVDADAARKGLDEYTQKYSSAQSKEDKAAAWVGVEVHKSLIHALETNKRS